MNKNTVLNQLRETAEVVGKPQSTVAANWMRNNMMKPYNANRNLGITRAEYNTAKVIIIRLANIAS